MAYVAPRHPMLDSSFYSDCQDAFNYTNCHDLRAIYIDLTTSMSKLDFLPLCIMQGIIHHGICRVLLHPHRETAPWPTSILMS